MIRRYEYGGITAVWDLSEVYRRWHRVEVVHVQEVAGTEVAQILASVRTPSPAQVRYYELQTGHDVAAFLRALDQNTQEILRKLRPDQDDVEIGLWMKARSSLHYALTSSDLVDTALAMGLQECAHVVMGLGARLLERLQTLDLGLVAEQTVGRTHGQLAAPMPASLRWAVFGEMADRALTRVDAAFGWTDVGKLSGPVGVGDYGEESALAALGLRVGVTTQIVPRDRLAHLAHCLAELVTVCEAIATQVWLLAQQGVDEVRVKGMEVVTSSAMPHKRNPVVCETIRGLARLARSSAEALQLGIVQWGEHDMAHSSVERVAVPDLLHLTCTALEKTSNLVGQVTWREPRLPEDYRDTGAILRSAQANGMAYVDAHAAIREGRLTRVVSSPITTTEEID